MAKTNGNDANRVAVGKPKAVGAVYAAPIDTDLPTDATTDLNEKFKCLGYVSEDGLENEAEKDTEETKAWGGDVVNVSTTSYKETFKYSLIEALNVEVLKHVYGDKNVEGTLETGVKIKKSGADLPHIRLVFETVLKGNIKRIVVPDAQVTEVGTIKYVDSDVLAYETTATAFPDNKGVTSIEYLATPKAAPGPGAG